MTGLENSTQNGIEDENIQEIKSNGQRQTKKDLIEWRYLKEIELSSKCATQSEIAEILKLDKSTISKDFKILRQRAREEIPEFLENVLPLEHKKTIAAYDEVMRQAWAFALNQNQDPRIRIQALGVISSTLKDRDEALTNPFHIRKAITARSIFLKEKGGATSQ